MLSDFIGEIASQLVTGPSTDRGRLVMCLCFGCVGLVLEGWTLLVRDAATHDSEWATANLLLGLVLGLMAVVFSVVHLLRHSTDTRLASVTAVIGAVAFVVPLFTFV